MKDKYSMSIDGNIFYAKRNIVDSIWKSANLEGISVTYPDTFEIFEGRTVTGLSVNDTIAINNLKHGWMFILDYIERFKSSEYKEPVRVGLIRHINSEVGRGIVSNSGDFRIGDVRIGGTSWKPSIPDIDSINRRLSIINSIECDTDRAVSLMLFIMRSQMFWDGNKRTAQLCCNYELIRHGRGILDIPIERQGEFRKLLIDYYETNEDSKIKDFIFEYCLDGTVL